MRYLTIVANNFSRYARRLTNVIVMLVLTVVTVVFAVVFTPKLQMKGHIALVARDDSLLKNAASFEVTVMESEPAMSDLMLNKFDAVVIDNGGGRYEIKTIKDAALKEAIDFAIAHPGAALPGADERGVGANILGYLSFFVLLQGVMFILPYSDDKENGVFKRIGTSPVSAVTYIAAHATSNFLLVFTPTFAVIAAAKLFGADLGFSLLVFAGFVALLSLLSTTFAVLVATLVKRIENCSIIGSVTMMLTTLLAGSFVSFSRTRPAFDAAISVLPQKSFLTLVGGIEQGHAFSGYLPQLVHILLLCAVFAVISILTASAQMKGKRA